MADFSSEKGKFDMKVFQANGLSNIPIHSSETVKVQYCGFLSNLLEQKCMSNRGI